MLSINLKKYVRSLHQNKYRQKYNKFLAEGPKLMDEILSQYTKQIEYLFCTQSYYEYNNYNFTESLNYQLVTEKELASISLLKSPKSCLAVMEMHEQSPSNWEKQRGKWTIYLDDIQDPGNVGTIIRTADWFGIDQMFASKQTASSYNPKVVQSSMGSVFRVKLHRLGFDELKRALIDTPVYAASLQGKSIVEKQERQPGIIVIGNESKGIQKSIIEQADHLVKIPAIGNAESLNASVANGILLFHFLNA